VKPFRTREVTEFRVFKPTTTVIKGSKLILLDEKIANVWVKNTNRTYVLSVEMPMSKDTAMKLCEALIAESPKLEEKDIERKDFGFQNLVVTKSKNEVRVWACNKEGVNVFRLKALGRIYGHVTDLIVMPMKEV